MAGTGHSNRIKGGDVIFPRDKEQSIRQKRRIFKKEYPESDFTDEEILKYGSGFCQFCGAAGADHVCRPPHMGGEFIFS